jgi:DNA-binding transcriptional ArsR family regulator
MVEYTLLPGQTDPLSDIFQSLADATRRDILTRVAKKEMTVSEIAKRYNLTFAGVSKHLKVLEKAKLIVKRRQGREQYVQMAPATIRTATDALEYYQKLWEDRFDSLEVYLKKVQEEGK